MGTELRVTLPGSEGSGDAARSLDVLERFLNLLGRIEEATLPQRAAQHTKWGFTDIRLGSLVTTLAPNVPAEGATSTILEEVAGRAVDGLVAAQTFEGLPRGWSLQAARAGADLAALLGLIENSGMIVELLHDGIPQRQVTVTRRAAENLNAAVRRRRQTIGSVVGQLDTISVHGRREAGLWHERTKDRVAVTFDERQTDEVRAALGRRVEISGRLTRDVEDRPISIRMRTLDFLGSAPATQLIGLDPNFTGGMEPQDYLREIRGAS